MQTVALIVGGFLCLFGFFCVDFNYISKIIYPLKTKPAIYLSYHILLKICMKLCGLLDKTGLTFKKKDKFVYQCLLSKCSEV